jgi:hypothetical protein
MFKSIATKMNLKWEFCCTINDVTE